MTTSTRPPGYAAEFRLRLPAALSDRLAPTGTLDGLLLLAAGNGWTWPRLADVCATDLTGARNPAAVLMTRLQRYARTPMPPDDLPRALPVWRQPLRWCGTCTEHGRWVDTPDGSAAHCPRCYTPPPPPEGRQ